MSLFDKVLGETSQVANSVLGKATTYVVTNASQKVSEAANKIADTIGPVLPFDRLGASLPSVKEITAKAIETGGSDLSLFLQQQIDQVTGGLIPSVSAASLNSYLNKDATADETHKISLSSNGIVIDFPVMPQISEQRSVGYEEIQPAQSPAPFQKYRGTGATVWTVNAMLVSRNSAEATANLDRLMTLRGWTKPYFGENTAKTFNQELGAPPPVLTLNGLRGKLLGPAPVVIQQLTWDWPRDVDYISTYDYGDSGQNYIPFPTILNISISLYESYSPAEINRFDLAAFRRGELIQAFASVEQRSTEG